MPRMSRSSNPARQPGTSKDGDERMHVYQYDPGILTVTGFGQTRTYGDAQHATYAKLKLAGLKEAPVHLAVFSDESTLTGSGLGRQTMPETLRYSVVAAVQTMWLAARAEGLGMGWVSILDPVQVSRILEVPADWRFIGYFCLGYPQADSDRPELERVGWEQRQPPEVCVLRR